MNQPTDEPPNPDELTYLGVAVPADLDRQLGYDPTSSRWADNRYLGFYWTPAGDELILTDGYSSGTGDWRGFQRWDENAGRQFLERAAAARDDLDVTPAQIAQREYVQPLTHFLRDQGWHIGSSDAMGNASLLFDREMVELFVGERDHVELFCQRFNADIPEWADKLPDDPESLQRLFERLKDELGDADSSSLFDGDEEE